jgi:predicted enzyme related to lactoylglutathione lyase
MIRHGTFIWNELMTPDVAAATAFYAAALGWTFTEQNMGEGGIYTLAHVPSQEMPVAGIYEWPDSQPGSRDWFPYVAIDDIDAALAKVEPAGGKVLRGPWAIPGVGKIAIVQDAAGSAIGYLEPEPM